MNHNEGKLQVDHGATGRVSELYWQSWQPDAPPRAAVLLVHGLGEHSGRYRHVATHLVERDVAVYAIDHSGHGRSGGVPGFVVGFEDYLDGVRALFGKIRTEQGQCPVFLVGHSMGGLIGAVYLLDHPSEFAGCVLSGPAVEVENAPPAWLLHVNRLLARLTPKVGMLKLDPAGVSRDEAVVADYISDPLVYKGKVSARLVAELFSNMQKVMANAGRIRLPILLLHGEADVLASPRGSRSLYELVGSSDKTLRIYPGLYHEIFNEPEQDEVLGHMSDWIAAHLPAQ